MNTRRLPCWALSALVIALGAAALAESAPETVSPARAPSAPAAALGAVTSEGAGPSVAPVPTPVAPEDAEAREAALALLASLAPEPGTEELAPPPFDPKRVAPRASVLPIPAAPPSPKPRRRFALPADDPALEPARTIARRVAAFPNLRALVPGATWRQDDAFRFAIRKQATCLAELAERGVGAHLLERPLTTPVPTPVVLDGPIEGVAFVSLHADRAVEMSCELATRLPALARRLRKLGVRAVGVNSSYREQPKVSFHSFGLALDMAAFRTRERTLNVIEHFEVAADEHTCEAKPRSAPGRALLRIACALADSGLFSSVLTPNYNEGHRDHFHVDVRPDDPRRFLR